MRILYQKSKVIIRIVGEEEGLSSLVHKLFDPKNGCLFTNLVDSPEFNFRPINGHESITCIPSDENTLNLEFELYANRVPKLVVLFMRLIRLDTKLQQVYIRTYNREWLTINSISLNNSSNNVINRKGRPIVYYKHLYRTILTPKDFTDEIMAYNEFSREYYETVNKYVEDFVSNSMSHSFEQRFIELIEGDELHSIESWVDSIRNGH